MYGRCSQMLEILERITEGEGKEEDLEILEDLAYKVRDSSLCGLGQTAPNPVLTTLHYFRDEYIAHIKDKKCPALSCSLLIDYSIDPEKCTGCTLCAIKCPTDAISGNKKEPHTINADACVKCGLCFDVCNFDAVVRT